MTNRTLKLGPGLRQDGDAIFVMKAGRLRFSKPNNCWVKSSEKRVVWGNISMVDAEKRLLANALQDTDNHHFILLSDSCVPLHNKNYVYNYLMDTNVGFIDSFEDPGLHGTGRYLDNMLLEIEKKDWRKGAQEMVLHRPCLWNGVKRPCYLFVRKFNPETLENTMQL